MSDARSRSGHRSPRILSSNEKGFALVTYLQWLGTTWKPQAEMQP